MTGVIGASVPGAPILPAVSIGFFSRNLSPRVAGPTSLNSSLVFLKLLVPPNWLSLELHPSEKSLELAALVNQYN